MYGIFAYICHKHQPNVGPRPVAQPKNVVCESRRLVASTLNVFWAKCPIIPNPDYLGNNFEDSGVPKSSGHTTHPLRRPGSRSLNIIRVSLGDSPYLCHHHLGGIPNPAGKGLVAMNLSQIY